MIQLILSLLSVFAFPYSDIIVTKHPKHKPQAMQQTDIFKLIDEDNIQKLKDVIKQGADIEETNASGQKPLLYALYAKKQKMALVLIEAGADVNAQDNMQNSAFLYAGATGYLDIVKACLQHGARFDIFNRYNGTALIPAAEKGHLQIVKLLAHTAKFPVNHINRLGWTALMEAIVLSDGGVTHEQIVGELIKAGADVNIPDHDGITPLQHARKKGFTAIVALLMKAEAK